MMYYYVSRRIDTSLEAQGLFVPKRRTELVDMNPPIQEKSLAAPLSMYTLRQ